MKKIALIILMLFLIGCGKCEGIASVDYSSSEGISSSIDVSSSDMYSSSDIAMSSHDINISSSSVGISSSSIISSSSVGISSSSSLKISSSSFNKIISSSSLMSSSSAEISSSSSSLMSSSSSAYKSTLFLFDVDSALGLEFYKTHNGETSPMYEIIANKIKSYLTYYNWSELPYKYFFVNDDIYTFKDHHNLGQIVDKASPTVESIIIQSNDRIQLTKSGDYIFKASNEIDVRGKRTFVLQRTTSNEHICNWYDDNQSKWISAGFSNAVDDNPFTEGICRPLEEYKF